MRVLSCRSRASVLRAVCLSGHTRIASIDFTREEATAVPRRLRDCAHTHFARTRPLPAMKLGAETTNGPLAGSRAALEGSVTSWLPRHGVTTWHGSHGFAHTTPRESSGRRGATPNDETARDTTPVTYRGPTETPSQGTLVATLETWF